MSPHSSIASAAQQSNELGLSIKHTHTHKHIHTSTHTHTHNIHTRITYRHTINACTETEIQSVFKVSTYNVWKNKACMHVNVFLTFLFAGSALTERERERDREHTHLPESPACTLRWAHKKKG